MDTKQIGKMTEALACQYLKKKGLWLLEQNYQCIYGEIDLIMKDQDDIVFVEVRSRNRIDFGSALESVTKAKMMKLAKTAQYFLQQKNWLYSMSSRFDIIAMQRNQVENSYKLEWIKHAFSVDL